MFDLTGSVQYELESTQIEEPYIYIYILIVLMWQRVEDVNMNFKFKLIR